MSKTIQAHKKNLYLNTKNGTVLIEFAVKDFWISVNVKLLPRENAKLSPFDSNP